MSLSSQRFLQFHPTAMLVTSDSSCFIIIRQNFFPVSFPSRIMQAAAHKKATKLHVFWSNLTKRRFMLMF
jgi:hypothetical protein